MTYPPEKLCVIFNANGEAFWTKLVLIEWSTSFKKLFTPYSCSLFFCVCDFRMHLHFVLRNKL